MNRFERQSEQTRRRSLQNSMLLWSTGGILLIAVLALLGYSGGANQEFWKGAAVVVAIFLLIVRQVGRRIKAGRSKAAKPDDRSMLHLD
jgi:4-hydroxybenzoate polyprenyltransferase